MPEVETSMAEVTPSVGTAPGRAGLAYLRHLVYAQQLPHRRQEKCYVVVPHFSPFVSENCILILELFRVRSWLTKS